MVAPCSKFYGKTCHGFCLNTGKRFFLEVSFWRQQKKQQKFLNSISQDWKRIISIQNCHIKANVKTNRTVSAKLTYHKDRSFASNYFLFWKYCFSLRTSYKDMIWCTNNPNAHTRTFCKRWSFIWRSCFPVSILKLIADRDIWK